ncbi:MAG: cellulase family glycosylhydrolase [Victivallales bacterium]|nr:cellulase family glycosylhydrolase [Victivallales bacterium]
MKRIAAICLALCSLCLFAQEYTKIPVEKMHLQECAKVENGVLTVHIPETPGITNQTRGANFSLPAKELAGKSVELSLEMRFKDVATDNKGRNCGAKAMMRITTAGTISYQSSARQLGTHWEWTPISIFVTFREKLENLQILLGIQQGWGTVEFRNVRWRFAELKYSDIQVPKNFRCEYTPEVAKRPVLRGAMSPSPLRMTAQDIRDFAAWNGNLIRFQMAGCGKVDLPGYNEWMEKVLNHLDTLAPVFEECKVWFIIDMHNPPGLRYKNGGLLGTGGDAAAAAFGNDASFRIMNDDTYYQAFLETWRTIARRFKGRPYLYGYNIVNEPVQTCPVKHSYLQLQYEAALAIREIDPETPIVIESNNWSSPPSFSYLDPLPLKNIIYQVHMYQPHEYTHQGVNNDKYVKTYPMMATSYPNPENNWDFNFVRKVLKPVIDFQKKYGARILVGEFSATTWAPGADKYLDDIITVFEENGWDWTYHAFREWQGWSVEHEGPPPKPMPAKEDTARKKVLLKWMRRNVAP